MPARVAGRRVAQLDHARLLRAARVHAEETAAAEVDELLALRGQLNDQLAEDGIRLSVTDLLVRASAVALSDHPEVNSAWGGDKVIRRGHVNIGLAIALVKPLLLAFTKHDWVDGEKLPAKGGVVVVANHVSHLDPLTFSHFLHDHGRLPRFLAKAELFKVFFVRTILRSCKLSAFRNGEQTAW